MLDETFDRSSISISSDTHTCDRCHVETLVSDFEYHDDDSWRDLRFQHLYLCPKCLRDIANQIERTLPTEDESEADHD